MYTEPSKNVRDIAYTKLGQFLGFPACCIAAFRTDETKQVMAMYPNAPWMGTGFIPCKCCAKKALVNFQQFVLEEIHTRRQCPYAFPYFDAWEGSDAMTDKIWTEAEATVRPPQRESKPWYKFDFKFGW